MNFARKPASALIVVGHGSTENPDSSDPTHRCVAALRARDLFAEVVPAFWKEEPSMREVLHLVASEEVYIVPNFISEGYFTTEVIPREMELAGRTTRRGGKLLHYCDPVGIHPSMTGLLLRRAAEVAGHLPPAECALIVVGHGTNLNTRSRQAIEEQARLIRQQGPGYADVVDAFMEEPPLVADWHKLTGAPNVIVVPFFIADGLHSYQDIPVLLGIEDKPGAAASQREVFRRNPHQLYGKQLFYASAVGTEPHMEDVILDQVAHFDAHYREPGDAADPAPRPPLAVGLGDWLARGGRRVGQVAILPGAGTDGSFRLCHADEADAVTADPGTRRRLAGAEAARAIGLFNDAGDFRPLPSAPDLPRGWVLDLDGLTELQRALDHLCPGALGLWLAHAAGHLAPTSLRAKLGRQTGMYRSANRISDTRAQGLVRRLCHPAGACRKRILWDLAESQPITSLPAEKFAPPAAPDADIPDLPWLCPEPCNLVVAEARKEARHEVIVVDG
jgi:sirohydrochlorin cobaltochelatase